MSEHRYYEFRTINRHLTDEEMSELRDISSRAEITPTRFVNNYNWGSLSADPAELVERYFDAFLFVTNYGSRKLMFRVPGDLIDVDSIDQYTHEDALAVWSTDQDVIICFEPRPEPGDDPGWWRHEDNLSTMLSVREQLIRGDWRALYLGWLAVVRSGWPEPDLVEPPVPAGLADLNPALEALSDFLVLDSALIEAAAQASPDLDESPTDQELRRWFADLPEDRTTDWLERAFRDDTHLSAEMQRAYAADTDTFSGLNADANRTVEDLREMAAEGDA